MAVVQKVSAVILCLAPSFHAASPDVHWSSRADGLQACRRLSEHRVESHAMRLN